MPATLIFWQSWRAFRWKNCFKRWLQTSQERMLPGNCSGRGFAWFAFLEGRVGVSWMLYYLQCFHLRRLEPWCVLAWVRWRFFVCPCRLTSETSRRCSVLTQISSLVIWHWFGCQRLCYLSPTTLPFYFHFCTLRAGSLGCFCWMHIPTI